MAGKRIYITVPERDAALIDRAALRNSMCRGQYCRRVVLSHLYTVLEADWELQDYDAELARLERAQVLHGR